MGYRTQQSGGPPTWFTFLLGVAFIFGGSYLWANIQSFMRSGVSVSQATQISRSAETVTAVRQVTAIAELPTRRPSATPKPPCQEFEVQADSGVMRQTASVDSRLIEALPRGTVVCVLELREGADGFVWYFIDRDPLTNFIEPAYMREDVLRPLNPTATPSNTPLPLPTITLTYTPSPTLTPNSADTAPTASTIATRELIATSAPSD
ncbi:MAG: hypothetical protein ACFE0Q_20450 [Anaerolineae bacterium]